jgi:hypothetical protein
MNTLHANVRFDATAGAYEVYSQRDEWLAAFDTIAQALAFIHDNAGEEGVHEFDSTGDAYDACQCDEDIKTGDTLIIRDRAYYGVVTGRDEDGFRIREFSEPTSLEVVGLAWAWPLAVTVAAGELHEIEADTGAYARVLADAGIGAAQVRAAVERADKMGLPVRMLFRAWLANAEVAADAAINDANLVAMITDPTPALEAAEVEIMEPVAPAFMVVYRPHNTLVLDTRYYGPFAAWGEAYDFLCELPAIGTHQQPQSGPCASGVKFVQQLTAPALPALEAAEVDLSDHPFSPESIERESGADTASDRAWFAWCKAVERLVGIEDLDGDQATDGYSIDFAHDLFADGDTPEVAALIIADDIEVARLRREGTEITKRTTGLMAWWRLANAEASLRRMSHPGFGVAREAYESGTTPQAWAEAAWREARA